MSECCPTSVLRQLDPKELVLGRVLPGNVRDDAGRVLIPQGQVLSPEHLQLLEERGSPALYAGPDWNQPPPAAEPTKQSVTPEELLQSLKRRHGLHSRQEQGRRHPRYPWRCELRVTIEECSDGLPQRREVTVETCDVSAGGFGFITRQFLHIGTIVFACFESLPNQPVMKGIVRYCHHLEVRRHRVGVEFVPLDPDERSAAS
jgi:hypothetical protein